MLSQCVYIYADYLFDINSVYLGGQEAVLPLGSNVSQVDTYIEVSCFIYATFSKKACVCMVQGIV